MSKPPPPLTPALPESVLNLPLPVRISLWMAYGMALGIPVDALFKGINLQLEVAKRMLGGKRLRWRLGERLKAAQLSKQISEPLRILVRWIVNPDSLIAWIKRYQQRKANSRAEAQQKTGRPWIGQEKVDAILRIYDSGLVGLSRIVGEMVKCGLGVAESTVRRVLTEHGRPPGDHNHRRGSTWSQFLALHAPYLVGADFIQMPIGLLGKIVNAHIFCAIEHDTRRVHLLGITLNPTDTWVANAIRSATMLGGPLAGRKYWILDNDGKYGPQTSAVLGKYLIWTSFQAPDMNALIERWNKSIEEECLDHIIFMSEEHLRHAVKSYISHYNSVRPHQGVGNVPLSPWQVGTGEIVCDESLHGLLKSFRRAA